MPNLFLKVPRKDQLFYRQVWMNNPKTMEYNVGYDIELKGYIQTNEKYKDKRFGEEKEAKQLLITKKCILINKESW